MLHLIAGDALTPLVDSLIPFRPKQVGQGAMTNIDYDILGIDVT